MSELEQGGDGVKDVWEGGADESPPGDGGDGAGEGGREAVEDVLHHHPLQCLQSPFVREATTSSTRLQLFIPHFCHIESRFGLVLSSMKRRAVFTPFTNSELSEPRAYVGSQDLVLGARPRILRHPKTQGSPPPIMHFWIAPDFGVGPSYAFTLKLSIQY